MVKTIFEKASLAVMDRLPDYAAVNLKHLRCFGRFPDLRHPRTFNEKIAWRKLYQHNPQFPVFSDKAAVKAEIAKLVGERYTIETLWMGSNPEDIPFDGLQPPYVIKVNHSHAGHVFIRRAQDISRDEIVASMREQLGRLYGYRPRLWGYRGIPRKVMVEHMIVMPDGGVPDDYKFFTYHGRVHFIQLDRGRFTEHQRNIYDREWNLLPVRILYPRTSEPVSKPANLGPMIDLAEKIGAQFDFVRVDLYAPPQGIFFGETTFYPDAGFARFLPSSWDSTFGEPWKVLKEQP
jgi:hypothetical protein